MWTMLLLLWLAPLAAGILIVTRVAVDSPPVSDSESEALFGDSKEVMLSSRMALEFILLAILFFIAGVFQGLVLANFSVLWLVAVPLLTGLAAMFILAYWLRSAPPASRVAQSKPAQTGANRSRIADLFTR